MHAKFTTNLNIEKNLGKSRRYDIVLFLNVHPCPRKTNAETATFIVLKKSLIATETYF